MVDTLHARHVPPERPDEWHVNRDTIADPVYAHAFPRWKWPHVRRCFPHRRVRFAGPGDPLPDRGTLLLWGMTPLPTDLPPVVEVLRIEDGFLRSVGLGAELARPLSWVADRRGVYYDASRPSDLEILLAQGEFSPDLRVRAAALRTRIVEAGLSKYNVGVAHWRRPPRAEQVVLVPGQVESDASLAYGAPGIRTNIALLEAVRAARPNAYIVYKPHPDVVARLRKMGDGEEQALDLCDEVVPDADIASLLDSVDEIQVLTSLAGFEALLREKPVICHGQPFYAGWGLTTDWLPPARRHRRLQLDELVAGALILYPWYLGRHGPIAPEQALDELAAWKSRAGTRRPWWWEGYRALLRAFIGVR